MAIDVAKMAGETDGAKMKRPKGSEVRTRGITKHTDETKARIAEAHRGHPKTKDHNRAVSDGWKRRMANGGEAPHGTPARYKNAHCRCDECRTAWRDYKRERRQAVRASTARDRAPQSTDLTVASAMEQTQSI